MKDSNKNIKKQNAPKFKFSPYWIYGAVFIALIAFQFLNSGSLASKSISSNKFSEVLNDNDIERIVIVNGTLAEIYIKPEELKSEKYKEQTNSSFYRAGSPIFEYDFGDRQNFENEINKAKEENNLDFDPLFFFK